MGPISPDDLRFNRFGLSQQESRVLALAMSGRIDKQIALEMGISLGTVRVYWKRIRMKVGGTRSEVIAELARTSLKLDFEGAKNKSDQLEKVLEESMARERALRVYESIFERLPMPLAVLDAPDGHFVRVNAAFAALHGYEVDELQDTMVGELMEPKERTKFATQAKKSAQSGGNLEIASTRRRKDGSTFAAKAVLSGGGESHWALAIQA